MKKRFLKFCAALFLCISLMYAKNEGTQKKGSKMADYKKETVLTVKGTVKNSDIVMNHAMNEEGLHLTLITDGNEYIIHVCPKWYAEKEKITFENGAEIVVTGSEFEKDEKANIYAAEIVTGETTLKLRDKDTGKNLWKGRAEDPDITQKDEQKIKRKGRKGKK